LIGGRGARRGPGAGIEGAGEDEEVTTYHLTTGTFDLVPQIIFDLKLITSTTNHSYRSTIFAEKKSSSVSSLSPS